MRIISKFNDYYDSCLAYGHDETVVYVRNTAVYGVSGRNKSNDNPQIISQLHELFEQIRSSHAGANRDWTVNWSPYWHDRNGFETKTHRYKFAAIGILFCGKYYAGIRVTPERKGVPGFEPAIHFYDAPSVFDFMATHGVDAETKLQNKFTKRTTADSIRQIFNAVQPDVEWLIEHKVTCVMYDPSAGQIVVNPCLKDIQFFKLFDTYSAFQTLDMWVSGTLAFPQNMMIELDDKYRVKAHGFDEKYGFRTRPGEK